jgi:alkylation response protein AidB-like acyl-CoA dehydrogenase
MASYFKDNDDLKFYFDRGIDWDTLVRVTEKSFTDEGGFSSTKEAVDFYRGVAEMVGEFVAEEIAPHAAQIDREGVRFEDGEAVFPERLATIFEKINALDLHGLCLPRELGGMNAPLLLYYINSEIMARADVSVMAHHGFHGGIAMAALVLSMKEGTTAIDRRTGRVVETRFREAIEEIASGASWGCMDITEPDAGSDMASLRAVGEVDADGNWFVTGEKIFITSGHGKWHFVIARTEAADPDDPMGGLNGLSMFLVPTYEVDASGERKRIVALSRVEEKLGHHGSATCGLVFDRAPAFLVGERGEGFKYMLVLMNNARLGVGFECLGLCEAALRLAKEYTAGRRSMGKSIDRHEMIADYLDEAEADVVGIRAMAMAGAYHEELAQKLAIVLEHYDGLSDEERHRYERELAEHRTAARRITPLLKYFAAEKAVEISRRCIQLHGGNGYMTEYGAEKLLRDALVMPIYEGTSQIQSLMAMKDTLMGIMKNPQDFVRHVAQARWRQVSARDPLEKRVARLQHLALNAQQFLLMKTAGDKMKGLRDRPITEWAEQLTRNWDPKRDFAFAMLHAERLTQILVDQVIAELLLEQAQKHEERAPLLERHLERAEIRSRYLYEIITSNGRRVLDSLAERESDDKPTETAAE